MELEDKVRRKIISIDIELQRIKEIYYTLKDKAFGESQEFMVRHYERHLLRVISQYEGELIMLRDLLESNTIVDRYERFDSIDIFIKEGVD